MASTSDGPQALSITIDGTIVIFLDIDGVLLPFPDSVTMVIGEGRLFPDEPLAALSKILQAFPPPTTVAMVLSSTWRVSESSRQEILRDFRAYGHGPLAQMLQEYNDFVYITDPTFHSERQHEIYRWLRTSMSQHLHIAAWIALDDEELLEGPANAEHRRHFDGHVVHCDSRRGLTWEQADQAIALIRQQLI